jgi:hypothetical protein
VASTVKNIAKSRLMSALMDLDEAGDDMRAILCMTNTTADTDVDADNTGTYTLDECDGANYARKTMDTQAVATDDANDRAEWDADDLVFTSLGNGTRQLQGVLIHEFITDDASSFPLAFVEFSSTINPGGSTLTVSWNAEGIVQIA